MNNTKSEETYGEENKRRSEKEERAKRNGKAGLQREVHAELLKAEISLKKWGKSET